MWDLMRVPGDTAMSKTEHLSCPSGGRQADVVSHSHQRKKWSNKN